MLKVPSTSLQKVHDTTTHKGDANTSTKVQHQPSVVNASETNVVINEFLCFTLCKMQYLANAILSKLCVEFYDDIVIESSKKLLHGIINPKDDRLKFR